MLHVGLAYEYSIEDRIEQGVGKIPSCPPLKMLWDLEKFPLNIGSGT